MANFVQAPLEVTIILGTPRQGRVSEHAAARVQSLLTARGVHVNFVDVRTFDFPQDDYGGALKNKFPEYSDIVLKTDAFFIVSPEYNHGYPGSLKMLLDLLLPEYRHKAVGIVGVSSGPWGGVRMVENLLPVLRELGLVVARTTVNVPNGDSAFNPNGVPTDPKFDERANKLIDDVFWLAEALRWGRNNLG
ncbi:MAG: NAD(P)H-dependent oxidoreductase [Patescibacteria group bacterium]